MVKKGLVLSVIFFALLFGCTTKSDNSDAVASDLKLQDLNGNIVKLSDFKGRPVLIDFWATWCPPCRASVPWIEKMHKAYNGKGLVVLGISLDEGGWEPVKSFVTEYGITYAVLKGNEDVVDAFKVRTIPMFIILNKDGKIVKRHLGFAAEDDLEKDIQSLL